ncbi:MAG: 30S ribosomal protein S2 [Candidatus Niyogibacteria bacterium]|nr:30S ribosomal protein S2 [Candidatus Niyogibacteria bacterium]
MSDVSTMEPAIPSEPSAASASETADPELEAMFYAKVHIGYSRTRRHPKMKPYIFGLRNTVEIFDLERVRDKIREAEALAKAWGEKRAVVLWVATKPALRTIIEKAAGDLGMPYVTGRWAGGLLTNFSEIRKRLDYFEDLKAKRASGELARYTKKEQLVFADELMRLEQKFGGIVSLKKLPDAVIIVDPEEEITASREARSTGVLSVGIANVDSNPELVNHVIPANDSAASSVRYIIERLAAAYQAGTGTE